MGCNHVLLAKIDAKPLLCTSIVNSRTSDCIYISCVIVIQWDVNNGLVSIPHLKCKPYGRRSHRREQNGPGI